MLANREVKSGEASLSEILKGVREIVYPVKSTLGAGGNTVLIARKLDTNSGLIEYPILVTKDGYTVTEHFEVLDPTKKIGVKMVKEAAQKTVDQAADGTTSTCLFLEAILEGGSKLILEGKSNPQQIKKGIDAAVKYIVDELKLKSNKIEGEDAIDKIKQIATVSANGDEVIGNLIAEAYSKIGLHGVINVEEAKGVNTSLKVMDGFKFGRGWASPYFINDVSKGESVLLDAYVLVCQQPIAKFETIQPILAKILGQNQYESKNKPLVVISPDCGDIALATLVSNNSSGAIKSCAINMAFLGDRANEIMEDIAAATGATFINDVKGMQLENIQLSHLGFASKVITSKEDTLIIGGNKDADSYKDLVSGLELKLTNETEDETEKKLLTERIARLKGNVAILSIGAATEVEMKEMKDRADDAVGSAKCAIEEGYLPGGGTALLRIEPLVVNDISRNEDFKKGQELIFDILKAPMQQICINAGVDFGQIYSKVMNAEGNIGYNARTGQIEDLLQSGIIDAAKVIRCSLQNAASVATMILISKCSIAYTY